MTENKAFESRVRGEDVANLLDHIAWTDTILPRLETARTRYQELLVDTTLNSSASSFTPTELAGRIYGINFIINTMQSLLKDRDRANRLLAGVTYGAS